MKKRFQTKEELLQTVQEEVDRLPKLEFAKNEFNNKKAVTRQRQVRRILDSYQSEWDRLSKEETE